MMCDRLFKGLVVLSANLLLGSSQAIAQVTIVEIPTLGGTSGDARAMNAAAMVAGVSHTRSNLEQHAFLFRSGVMHDLGTLSGRFSQAWDINSAGHVVGQSTAAGALEQHAFLYRDGQMLDLGTLGGTLSTAVAINDLGHVAGSSYIAGSLWRAFVYANDQMSDLGTLGGTYSVAVDINSSGQVVGQSYVTDNMAIHAFLYSAGAMIDLGTLGGPESYSTEINSHGWVTGDAYTTEGESHAFLYHDGEMHDLGTLGGTYSTANALNDQGQVIGVSVVTNDAVSYGFFYDNGVMHNLGNLGSRHSTAWGLNNLGQVVGFTFDVNRKMVAFLWENGAMRDLNTLLETNSGWELLAGKLINDAGQIVGIGKLNGRATQFLLTLTAVNHPPVADAGADQTVECPGVAALDGSGSSDQDGDALSYEWSRNGVVVGRDVRLEVSLPLGVHELVLVVTDLRNASHQDKVVVTVVDTTAPSVTCPVSVPVAAADANCHAVVPDARSHVVATDNCNDSPNLERTQSPEAGTVVGAGNHVLILTVADSSGNSASCTTTFVVADQTPPVVTCPEPVVLTAAEGCQAMAPDFLAELVATDNCAGELTGTQSPEAGSALSVGDHVVTVTVMDAAGNHTECAVAVSVVDRTAPVFSMLSVNPKVLHPANHSMVAVSVTAEVTDNCDSAPVCRIVSISSNEPETGKGDNTGPDFWVTGATTAELRAERSGDCRVYTLTVECRDAAGNVTMGEVHVQVPKGNKDVPGSSKKVVLKDSKKAAVAKARRLANRK